MDANAVFRDLFHHGIISDGDQESIAKANGRTQQNTILHACLLRTCTNEALLRACGIMVFVRGNPKMSVLGADMQKRLESGVCAYACVYVCVLPLPHWSSAVTCCYFPSLFAWVVWCVCVHARTHLFTVYSLPILRPSFMNFLLQW